MSFLETNNLIQRSQENSSDKSQVSGWADSIAKVLNTTKPKSRNDLVLSRAKKNKSQENDDKSKNYGFEVVGEIEEQKPAEEDWNGKLAKEPKGGKAQLRVKPCWNDMERERALRKVATKGVVQLFNAVRKHQKDLQHQLDAAGPLDIRKEAVLNKINKRKFLDILMGGRRGKSEVVDNPIKREIKKSEEESSDSGDDINNKKKKKEWNVLRDDFMTNKKIKHWDENSDSNNQTQSDDSEDGVD
uniref:RRP15-like protein n=1 Tax=Glossina palpalis gambiensis TaxID=67801 RepID=A0A1B0BF49_9MUSC